MNHTFTGRVVNSILEALPNVIVSWERNNPAEKGVIIIRAMDPNRNWKAEYRIIIKCIDADALSADVKFKAISLATTYFKRSYSLHAS